MTNRLRKAPVGRWEVLREAEDGVYFGFPRFASLFNDRREVAELFKVDRNDLERRLPAFHQAQGNVPRGRALEILDLQRASLEKTEGFLSADAIELDVTAEGRTVRVRLSPKDLSLISVDE